MTIEELFSRMPRCWDIFEKYTESYPKSWMRKIIWEYQKFKEEDMPFCWTDIRNISGVKKKNILMYLLCIKIICRL